MIDMFMVIIAVISAITVYIKKGVAKQMSKDEYMIISATLFFFVQVFIFAKKKYVDKKDIDLSKIWNFSVLGMLLVYVIARLWIAYQKLSYLKRQDVSKYYPLFKSFTILASFMIGVIIMKEKKTTKEWLGIALITGGVFFMCSTKKDDNAKE
jgi:uncharacterized membrane protein